MEQETLSIFGSRTRAMVLEEVAKAVRPLSASSIARVGGVDAKNVYEEFGKLKQLGIFYEVPIGKNQKGYTYSDSQVATKLKEFIKLMLEKQSESIIDRIAAFFPIADYYISLPVSLRVTFDVFYSPTYLLLFVNKGIKSIAAKFVRSLGAAGTGILLKPVSLWGREFRYDEARRASLATNEQAVADGLNYYDDIRDREVIRTLITRTSDIDLNSVIAKLDRSGITRLWAILAIKDAIVGDVDKDLLDLISRRREKFLMGFFGSDLESEIVPLLLPNDEADKAKAFARTVAQVSAVMRTLDKARSQ